MTVTKSVKRGREYDQVDGAGESQRTPALSPPKKRRTGKGASGAAATTAAHSTVAAVPSSSTTAVELAEKRLARFKPTCPKSIAERIERVRTQRFFLIDRDRADDQLSETFKVLGSTGNVYTVCVRHQPSCDCPDAGKGNHCKHIIFALTKVLGLPWESPHVYQKALLTSELREIFDHAPAAPHAVQDRVLSAAWERVTGSPSKEAKAGTVDGAKNAVQGAAKRLLPGEDDTCPVCYEDIHEEDPAHFAFCDGSCGKPIHMQCMRNWAAAITAKGEAVTCVWCRAPWTGPENPQQTGDASSAQQQRPDADAEYEEGYMNLAGVMGLERRRDVSTYYTGPRRGMTWEQAEEAAYAQYGSAYRGMAAHVHPGFNLGDYV